MKRLKYFGLMLVVFILSLSCFVGCAGDEEPSTPPPNEYSVSFSVENSAFGTISAKIKDGDAVISGSSVVENTQIVLTATANTGYSFVGWFENDENVSNSAETTVTLTKNINYVAKFSANNYSLTVSSEDENKGSVNVVGGQTAFNTQVTIIATPVAGFAFVGWFDGQTSVSTDTTYTFNMPAKDYNLVAKFSADYFALNVSSENTNKGTVSGDSGNIVYGVSVTVVAQPKTGYSFEGWYDESDEKIVGANASYTFGMPASNCTLVAKFIPNNYVLSVSSDDMDMGTVSGDSGEITFGENVTVVATANTGYEFEGWYDANDEKILGATASYSFDMPASGCTLVAKFTVKSFALNVLSQNVEQGTVSNVSGDKEFNSRIIVTATAKSGYQFEGWYVSNVKIQNAQATYEFFMPASAYTIVAKFEKASFNLSVSSEHTDKGTVSGDSGNTLFQTSVTVNATNKEGYTFEGWYDESDEKIIGAGASYTFNMPANNCVLVAKFSTNSYMLKFASESASKGTVEGVGVSSQSNVPYKTSVTINATAKEGYTFEGWYDVNDEKIIGADASYTFEMPYNNYDITAKFTLNSHVFSFDTLDSNMGRVEAENSIVSGSEIDYFTLISLSAIAENGYEFEGWYIDGTQKVQDAQSHYTFRMPDKAYTLKAKFKAKQFKLNFSAENGDVIGASGVVTGDDIDYNSTITLTASEKTGYVFDAWYEGSTAVCNTQEFEFEMPAKSYTLVAKFKPDNFLLNFTSEDNSEGTVLGTIISGNDVEYKKSVTVTATAKSGYEFEGWYENSQKIENACAEYTFDMPAREYILVAKFSIKSFELKTSSYNTVMGSVSGNSGTIEYNSQVNVIATPEQGYEFESWYAVTAQGDVWVSRNASYEFNMPANVYELKAKFVAKAYTLTFRSDNIEMGTVAGTANEQAISPETNIKYTSQFTLTASEKEGYNFEGWYVNNVKVEGASYVHTFTMPSETCSVIAKFVAETRKVTFYDGTIIVHTQTLAYNTALSSLSNVNEFKEVTKEGYSFQGWTTVRDSETTYNLNTVVKEDFVLYAKWQKTIVYYTVEFRYEDNSVELSLPIEENTKIPQTATPDELEGYKFERWYYFDNNQEKQTFDKDTYVVNSNIVIYAEYSRLKFNVTFNADNGEANDVIEVFYEDTVSRPELPTKENYDFIGWYVGDTLFQFNTPITDNITLTAKWQEVVPDTFKVNFYDDELPDGQLIHNETVYEGGFASIPTDVTKTGYNLIGWFYKVNSEEIEFTSATAVESNIEVYAKFTKQTFTVTFIGYSEEGVLGTLSSYSVAYKESATAPNVPERIGYTFSGWDKKFDSIEEEITVTAKYTIKTYTVRYMDGDMQIGEDIKANHGTKLSVPENPSKDRFEFKGWFSSSDLSSPFVFADTNIASDMTIYAKFEQNIFEVTFIGFNGAELGRQEVMKGESAQQPSAPSIEGYRFDGWDREFVNVIADITITAKYIQLTFTVTFVGEEGQIIKEVASVAYGSTVASIVPTTEIPSVDFKIFAGWDKNVNEYIIKENTTFTAKYEFEKRTVTFYLSDGVTVHKTVQVSYGSMVNIPSTPEQVGTKIFDYWYVKDAESNEESLFEAHKTPITSDISVYAKFKEIGDGLIVKFVAPDGITQVGKLQTVQREGFALEPPPYEEGYVWCLQGTTTPYDFETQPIIDDTTFIAVLLTNN